MNGQQEGCRVILLVAKSLRDFEFESLRKICECKRIVVPAIFINDEPKDKVHRGFFKTVLRVARKRKSFTLALAYYSLKKRLTGKGFPGSNYNVIPTVNLKNFCDADIHNVKNLYSQETADVIKSYKPDLCFHYGYGWIKEPILSIPKNGIIGYHHGDLTKYRGQPPCFWELYNGEKQVGVTIQRLKERLDAGEIVMQRFFDIRSTDGLESLQDRVYRDTVDMGLESVLLMANPNFAPRKPPKIGKLYTTPTLVEYARLQLKTRIARFLKTKGTTGV